MKLWRRAAGAIKDKLSLITATDEKFTAAIIKATRHNDLSMNIENVQFIYRYIQSNPSSFKPIIRAVSLRVERTRNWTVALKCLMLLHGLFFSGTMAVDSIGRLPFDLSDFGKRKSRFSRTGRFNIFVRAYFSFLDERSILFYNKNMIRLEIIVKMQRIVDSLMRIKPIGKTPLVIEAMEYVISEVVVINGHICRGFASFLSNVQSNMLEISSAEAELAMKIVAKSLSQREQLFKYFEFCRDFGVTNAQEISSFVRITESQVIVLDKLLHIAPELDRKAAKVIPVTAADMAEVDLVTSEECSNSPSDLISF
ncbi:AP180 N-terminal homology (ANTH) domain protein [Arabidopsis suecica]|uniref:AP180 N-terminal homology (ANTH) domain protein n=1 Tax=Arabidopsis suecica TaxID=45249 RepID=A0A8T1ZSF6_ARASU|nr:AP180 N-terminal homology (ANTH) domain protein [Arabidopsis suecica]